MTDLERRLSARLHHEAAQLVPDTAVPPPLPRPPRRSRVVWRAPVLAAAAVLVVAVGAAVVVQAQRGDSAATGATVPDASPVQTAPAPAFSCIDAMTSHTAQTGTFRIGITAGSFCVTADGSSRTVGGRLQRSGALRSWVSTDLVAAGVVDPSVDRVVWRPDGTGQKLATTGELYSLGTVNGFVFPISSAGTLLVYSGSSEVAREQIPYPGQGSPPASSSAAARLIPPTDSSAPFPGGDIVTPLATPVTVTGAGTQTVELGAAPAGTTAINVALTCLTAGTFQFSEGAAVQCANSDIGKRSATSHYKISADETTRTTTITTNPDDRWRATFTYSKVATEPWGVNARGQTYGVANDNGTPDLISATAANGKSGFVLSEDLDGSLPTSPSQAATYDPGLRTIPVYTSDGVTQIGTFVIAGK